MSKIVVDQSLREKLLGMREALELCDESGQLIGHFWPVPDHALYEGEECPLSDEELARRAQERSGRTLAEIMADLEGRP